ncbi:hypothetical protein [Candidatus Rhabdochlamydia oedothoracis]|uniref:hypothetical protein n=1 Tax=Candidatus Rhabdochlamydia oedothoracis TaxID=2720720 RepID=UPI001C64FD89|nr:hypothetical protein [Candidatus Rhabdochlamydia oedothoracis]
MGFKVFLRTIAKTMKKLIYLALCIFSLPFSVYTAQSTTLKNRFEKGSPGDFIVTAQEGIYTILILRHREKNQLILEEISIPQAQLEIKKIHWQNWLDEKAPGHTSWSLFEIDLSQGKLIESYSINKQSWLYIDSSEFLLSKLLELPLYKVSKEARKKIGPPPGSGEQDFRSIWNPPLVCSGKALKKPSFAVYQGQWPHDQSIIEDCLIDFYFSSLDPLFPFPYWLEIQSTHYTLTIRAIDSGKGLISPIKGTIPHRLPNITVATKRSPEMWTISIQAPVYCHNLKLYAIESDSLSEAILIPFQLRLGSGEEVFIDICPAALHKILKKGSYYRWVLIPASDSLVQIHSWESFLWE